MKTNAFMVAGAGSGTGKTTVTLGLMAALKKQGYHVQGFKTGPDYIDPSLHKMITGSPSVNLDTWMMPAGFLTRSFQKRAVNADISVVEGVMGLFDGKDPVTLNGSSAELAIQLGLPVILVMNVKSMARTAAALINGLVSFEPRLNIIGVVLNFAGSKTHMQMLGKSVAHDCVIPVFGGLPRNESVSIPSRHLGLFMGEDQVLTDSKIDLLAAFISEHLDIEKILRSSVVEISPPKPSANKFLKNQMKKTVAIARDPAFCFYYQDNIETLENLGYEIVCFSPLKDKTLPEADAYYFGGGYPELYAKALSQNQVMRESVYKISMKGKCIYAECGGLMYLGKTITTHAQEKYAMCGCFDFETTMMPKLQSLGYVEVYPEKDFFIFKKGQPLRGHAFHYSMMKNADGIENIYCGTPEKKAVGLQVRNTLASYVHLHFAGIVRKGNV